MMQPIDVIIPVHGNFADTARTINSVLSARNEIPIKVIVIDDASPDEDAEAFFAAQSAHEELTILHNPRNIGFAATVNRGMSLNPDRDVVLLNSDTLVFDGWLDRMAAAMASNPRAATVTPLSNSATILSYPHWLVDNNFDLEIDWPSLDRICARATAPPIEIPTGVGFCFLIRRECLDAVGDFDAVIFRDGYGEENDFCLRASRAGWTHLAATNAFVWHRGGGSFGAQREIKSRKAQAILEQRHPGYGALIREFISSDPLRGAREEIDYMRISALAAPKTFMAGACPLAPVGAGKQIIALSREGPFWSRFWRASAPGLGPLPNLPFYSRRTNAFEIKNRLIKLGVSEITVPSRGAAARSLIENIVRAANELRLPVRHV